MSLMIERIQTKAFVSVLSISRVNLMVSPWRQNPYIVRKIYSGHTADICRRSGELENFHPPLNIQRIAPADIQTGMRVLPPGCKLLQRQQSPRRAISQSNTTALCCRGGVRSNGINISQVVKKEMLRKDEYIHRCNQLTPLLVVSMKLSITNYINHYNIPNGFQIENIKH